MQWGIVTVFPTSVDVPLVYGEFKSARYAQEHLKHLGWTPIAEGKFVSPDAQGKMGWPVPIRPVSDLE